MPEKKRVNDMSGFCRFPASGETDHRNCKAQWETPSAIVTCVCTDPQCWHVRRDAQPRVKRTLRKIEQPTVRRTLRKRK